MKNRSRIEDKGGFCHPGHRLVSRRDFLGQGLIAGAGMVMGPTLLGLLGGSRASAQAAADCGIAVGGAGKIPFLCFDLAGGANIAGSNVLVGGPGGQLDLLSDEGYLRLGLPADMTPAMPGQVNTDLGLAFHSDSAFLRGILDKTSAATRANTNGTIICARSDNDTGNNPHNPMYGINKAGANGDLVALVGTESSDSGGKSQSPMSMFDPAVRPTKVDRPRDATGLVDVGKLTELLDQDQAVEVMNSVERLSALKVDRLTEDQVLKDLISCTYVQGTDTVQRYGNPALLDPEQDPDIVGNGGILSNGEMGDSKLRSTASIMKLVINGFAGAGTIELGGYDYHNGTRGTGEVRDFQAGQCMGAALEYAARRGQQLMIYVFSDGSVDSSDAQLDNSQEGRGKFSWRGDNGSTAATFILVYDPAGRPALTRPEAAQIGYFRPSGSVETASTRVAENVDILAEAVVLNYLALHGDVGRLDQVLPNHGLGMPADQDALTAFAPIRQA